MSCAAIALASNDALGAASLLPASLTPQPQPLHARGGAPKASPLRQASRHCWQRARRLLAHTAMLVGTALLLACSPAPTPQQAAPPPLSRTLALGADAAGFEVAIPRPLQFPQDHAAHPRFRIEWWYLTARLQSAEGHRFGAQFALFRFALRPEQQALRADWQGAQVYMLHAALSDIDGGAYRSVERFARGAAGLAGVESGIGVEAGANAGSEGAAEPAPWRGWLGDCEARSTQAGTLFPMQLHCGGEGFRYRLRLDEGGPRVLHGEAGYSAKSALAGAASHYYAYPFIDAAGEVEIDGVEHTVNGQAWYDHEWASSLLGAGQIGWDWFSLRLSSGEALMLFHIRDRSGAVVSSRGSWIGADGRVRAFEDGVVQAEPLQRWTSPDSSVAYPLQWRLRSERFGFDLKISPTQPAQEFDGTVRYWEGAIDAAGTLRGQPVRGEGYLELTGYDEQAARRSE